MRVYCSNLQAIPPLFILVLLTNLSLQVNITLSGLLGVGETGIGGYLVVNGHMYRDLARHMLPRTSGQVVR